MKKGFTLIELLIVISVISILSGVIFSSLSGSLKHAKYSKAKVEIKQLMGMVRAARINTGRTFGQITGNFCTECGCRDKGNIQLLPKTDSCWTQYQNSFDLLKQAAGNASGLSVFSDPWGAPYLFNENEGEACCCIDMVNWCCTDNILSAGPDGLYYNSDDIVANIETECRPEAGSHHPNSNW